MFQKKKSVIGAIVVVLLIATPLFAQGSSDNLSIHGYVSRGYLKSSGNNYLASDSKEGCMEYGEAILNFTTTPVEKLRIGTQLYARDLDMDGNFYVVIDWAYGDYHWNDFLGFRLGRFKNPMGLYGKVRDVDMARVPIFLPQSTYAEPERDMNLAVDGIGVYGRINTGFIGDFEYEAVYGGYNIFDIRSSLFNDNYYKIGTEIANGTAQTPGILSAECTGTANEIPAIEDVMGLHIAWHTPLNGLKVGASFNTLRFLWEFDANIEIVVPTGDPANPTFTMVRDIPVLGDYDIKTNAYFGEWQLGNFTLAGEYRRFIIDGVATISGNANKSVTPRDLYYGMGSYRVNNWLALSGYYSVFYLNADDKEGAIQVAVGKPDYYAWQKDICLTARFDLTQNWIMKVEYHNIDGTGQVSEIFNPEGFERKWGLMAVKSTFHF